MKTLSVLLLFAVISMLGLNADDLSLTDGRIFKNAKLFSPSATDIAVIHDGGVENISLDLLPPDIRSNYYQVDKVVRQNAKAERPNAVTSDARSRSLGIRNIGNVTNSTEAMDAVVLVNTYDRAGEFLGHGTGFYLGDGGHVVTNVHVVDGSSTVEIVERDGDSFTLDSCMFAIPCRDFAVLKVETAPEFYFQIAGVPEIADKVAVLGILWKKDGPIPQERLNRHMIMAISFTTPYPLS